MHLKLDFQCVSKCVKSMMWLWLWEFQGSSWPEGPVEKKTSQKLDKNQSFSRQRENRTRAEHPVRCVVRCVATSSKRTLQGEHQTWETLKTPCSLAVFNPSCALRCQTLHNSRQIFPKNWALSAKQQCNPRIGGATGESKQVAKWQRRCSVTRWVDVDTHTHTPALWYFLFSEHVLDHRVSPHKHFLCADATTATIAPFGGFTVQVPRRAKHTLAAVLEYSAE